MSTELDQMSAMRHFLLCDAMKAGPFHPRREVLAAVACHQRRIATIPDAEVAASVQDDARRTRYAEARWTLEVVNLAQCEVWPTMGGRPWAVGTVTALLPVFRLREPKDQRIWGMVDLADLFDEHLRIVVLRRGRALTIDDGSHRAIAMGLAGRRTVHALVGTL